MSGGEHPPARVLLVEDQVLLSESLVLALRNVGIDAHRSALASRDGVLEEATDVDIVLLDLDLGALGSGTDLVEALVASGAHVVVVTGLRDRATIAEAVARGAIGYLTKNQPFEELVDAVAETARQGQLMSRAQREQLLAEAHDAQERTRRDLAPFRELTATEAEVLAALMRGASAREIAADRVVAVDTVRTQIRSILRKLDVNSQLAAIAYAHHVGWEGPHEPPR